MVCCREEWKIPPRTTSANARGVRRSHRQGRSRVAYIGTTEKGIYRIAASVAYRAPTVFRLHGVTRFEVRIVTCRPRQRVKTWRKLERAMLLSFRDKYGEVPRRP